MIRGEFKPGHLREGGVFLNFVRHHAACVVCSGPFDGAPNQKICGNCRGTERGRAWVRNRQLAAKRRSDRERYAKVKASKECQP